MPKIENTEPQAVANTPAYHAPTLTDYGPASELTETISGRTGDDGGNTPSSYTAS
ncbi:hypothetical protein GCM10007939_04300 [Amylibacter marinus]|uniref:Lasso RiPP family leader peptide-containing protein n=1 Tax=Amylibacter marinus TaxID=1475483 RepID=A0ABQ5VSB3_9RHOB|nr:lasso RiPP family leader peptide-containing protein [Amylibacter marinus]GLQ34147.1 hypothetical protein GCM10007939_04300 [Amylibacter marinus]